MAEDKVRLSQVVGVFGPGAMLDLPERSVLIQGLDHWEMFGTGTFHVIEEPRLARLLHQRLKDDGRLVADRPPELRTPPIDAGDPKRKSPGIKATVFPRWFACDAIAGDPPNRRRLARFQDLEPPKRQEHMGDDGKRGRRHRSVSSVVARMAIFRTSTGVVSSTRTFAAKEEPEPVAPAANRCGWRMRVRAPIRATPASFATVARPCRLRNCFSLAVSAHVPASGPGSVTAIRTPAMHLTGFDLLTRSATNTYFAQVARVVSLPQTVDELARRIEAFWSVLEGCTTVEDIHAARRFNPALRASLEAYSDEAVLAAAPINVGAGRRGRCGGGPKDRGVPAARERTAPDRRKQRRGASSCRDAGSDGLGSGPRSGLRDHVPRRRPSAARGRLPVWLHAVRTSSAGDRRARGRRSCGQRRSACADAAIGFRQWSSSARAFSCNSHRSLSLIGCADPRFWRGRDSSKRGRRLDQCQACQRSISEREQLRERERPEYVMAHSLAHALMTEVAIDCGYPASALKERLYVFPPVPGQPIQCGILIYTATAGNQGTLGGLVEVTHRFARILKSALERQRLCSGDPVCADHDPDRADEDRTLHGAACHGCLLVAETSCEARNVLLDRALIVDTVGPVGASFFGRVRSEKNATRGVEM